MQLITRRHLLTGTGAVLAQRPIALAAQPAGAALVVGISQYDHMPTLPSAVMDATLLAASFQNLGWNVSLVVNCTKEDLLRELAVFQKTASLSSLTVVYVAAHGGMAEGQSAMFCKDAREKTDRVPETLFIHARNSSFQQKVLFLDCCRDNLFKEDIAQKRSTSRAGVFVSYATQPNAVAFDGGQTFSPYAYALHRNLKLPSLEVSQMAQIVRREVIRATQGQQIPWERSSLISPVFLNLT